MSEYVASVDPESKIKSEEEETVTSNFSGIGVFHVVGTASDTFDEDSPLGLEVFVVST